MAWTLREFAGCTLILISILSLISLGAAELQVYQGDSVTLENANTTITWGQNYTFNAPQISTINETLGIGEKNISIGSNTTDQVNATLWEYNSTGPYHNKTAVKLDVSAVNDSNVTFSFDGLPGFRFGRYELDQNGTLLEEFRSGGEINWYETNWPTHNYTIMYYNDTTGPDLSLSLETGSLREGGSIKISCSASDISGVNSSSLRVKDSDGDSYSLGCGQEFEETGITGEYTVKYSAMDKAGNSNSVSKVFDVSRSSSGGGGGGGSSGGGSSFGSGSKGVSDSNTWISANKNRFSFKNIDSKVDVQSVTVSTDRNMSSFRLNVERLTESPPLPELPEDTYHFYEFTAKNEEEISSTEIRFKVNQSFANRYNEVVISHYKDGWNDLDTELIESSGDKWIYETAASGFSYYAVRGKDRKTTDNGKEETTDNDTNEEQTGPVCGDNTCQNSEDWESCSQDCSKPRNVTEAEQAISTAEQQIPKNEPGYQLLQQAQQQFEDGNYTEAQKFADKALNQHRSGSGLPVLLITGLILVAVLAVAGYFGRSYWMERQVKAEIKRIKREVHEKVNNDQVDSPRRMLAELDRAEKALKLDDYSRAKKYLDKVERMLD